MGKLDRRVLLMVEEESEMGGGGRLEPLENTNRRLCIPNDLELPYLST